jgi:uncharacterized protein
MRKRISKQLGTARAVEFYGEDILNSESFSKSHKFIQHGDVSVLEHSISVSCLCVYLARKTHLKFDYKALVRGALLHDYFQYDWHEKGHRLHGYRHADKALQNAADDYAITPIEAQMIARHMFPLNIRPPRTREGVILCIADKICTTKEVFSKPFYDDTIKIIRHDK